MLKSTQQVNKEKVEKELAGLNSTLRKQCIYTHLITIEQWNEEIAPTLSRLSNVVNGLMPESPTARTYRLPLNYFE